MLQNLSKYRIILASNSPRRRELLAGLGLSFTVRTLQDIDESYPETLQGEEIPMHISKKKAAAYLPTLADDELLITADTIVYLRNEAPSTDNSQPSASKNPCKEKAPSGEVLGKPHDEADARRMLRELSGRSHEVITGVSIVTKEKQKTFAVTSHVSFAQLTDEVINYYVKNYHPMDKAGAYGIQEWIGFVGVNGLEGSYFNVMGLPVQRLYEELNSW